MKCDLIVLFTNGNIYIIIGIGINILLIRFEYEMNKRVNQRIVMNIRYSNENILNKWIKQQPLKTNLEYINLEYISACAYVYD